jgi:alkanesulfonate monooxygenase SsuD/methylene tetrahydromethanopterin reductase-like flavin-dependent oxidoreductase (luciferase family)
LQNVKSGIFIMPFHSPEKPLAQCHDEDMELALRADELGYDEFWVGEHHTLAWEPIVSPEMWFCQNSALIPENPQYSPSHKP